MGLLRHLRCRNSLERSHLIDGGVADIVNGEAMFLLKELHLEGEDGEELIDIALEGFDAPLLPRPQLRRDVVIDWAEADGMDVFGYLEIETWVIDEDDNIRAPRHDVVLALLQTS